MFLIYIVSDCMIEKNLEPFYSICIDLVLLLVMAISRLLLVLSHLDLIRPCFLVF